MPIARWLAECLLFTTLAVAATYPLAARLTAQLPLAHASGSCASVPLLNLWTLWWNVHSLEHGYRHYWHAPIYYPERWYFAASEPQTVVGWLAWPLWRTLPSSAAVYNTLLLLFLTLNGWTTQRLLRRLGTSWPVSLFGGAAMLLLPLVHWQLGVLQLISLWGIVWVLHGLVLFRQRPGAARALHLAIAFAVTYSLCCYYGLFLSLLLVLGAPVWLGRRLIQWRFWCWSFLAASLAAGMLYPIVRAQLQFIEEHPFSYGEAWVRALSAVPRNYLQTPWSRLPLVGGLPRSDDGPAWPLSPGSLKLAGAGLGVVLGVASRRTRRVTGGLVVLGILATCASLGPRLGWGAVRPYHWLADYYPGFGNVRSFYRFGYFVQIALVLLVAIGLDRLLVRLRCRQRIGRLRPAVLLSIVLFGGLMLFESWPDQPACYRLPSVDAHTRFLTWLRASEQRGVRLLFLPLPRDQSAEAMQPTTEWMYFQTLHGRTLANGYSTLVPSSFGRLVQQMRSFPDSRAYGALVTHGITHVVFDKGRGAVVNRRALESLEMALVLDDREAGIEIWALFPP